MKCEKKERKNEEKKNNDKEKKKKGERVGRFKKINEQINIEKSN